MNADQRAKAREILARESEANNLLESAAGLSVGEAEVIVQKWDEAIIAANKFRRDNFESALDAPDRSHAVIRRLIEAGEPYINSDLQNTESWQAAVADAERELGDKP